MLAVTKAYFRLATVYGKGKSIYGVLGFTLCMSFSMLLYSAVKVIMEDNSISDHITGPITFQIYSLAGSCALCYLVYLVIEHLWKKELDNRTSELIDE